MSLDLTKSVGLSRVILLNPGLHEIETGNCEGGNLNLLIWEIHKIGFTDV